jgi:hypothetical protein
MAKNGFPSRFRLRHTAASLVAAGAVSAVALAVYLSTLTPGVTFIDSGELATVASTLGIAHPTGYPLFTLVGWLFSKIPVAQEQIVRLNIMAAVFCAAGIFFFVLLLDLLLDRISRRKGEGSIDAGLRLPAAAGAGLLLAFSETYWSQALAVEVYSLHLLLLALVLLTFCQAAFGEEGADMTEHRWLLFAFLLGLSFTNHMTTILLAPGLLYLYFWTQGWGKASWFRVLRMAVPFAAALSLYIYLPVRAAQSPLLDWGYPATLERFLWHVSGKQYRVWIFSSMDAAGKQLQYFINSVPAEHAYVGLILAVVGLPLLWRRDRRVFICTVLLFVGCVFYSINYDIHDIDSYFLLAYLCIALWAGYGLYQIGLWLLKGSVRAASVRTGLLFLPGIVAVVLNLGKVNQRDNHLVEDYTMNMFASLQPGALVFSYQWDYWVSASYYFQLVDGMRPDLVVIDKELLRRSWYLRQLGSRYPWLIQRSREEVDGFLREVDKFEHDLPYDPDVIQARYVRMIASFIDRNLQDRPVYVTSEIEPEFTAGLQRVPEGLAQRLYRDTLFHPTTFPPLEYRAFPRKGREEDMIRRLYAEALAARAYYYVKHDRAEAERCFARARSFVASRSGQDPR